MDAKYKKLEIESNNAISPAAITLLWVLLFIFMIENTAITTIERVANAEDRYKNHLFEQNHKAKILKMKHKPAKMLCTRELMFAQRSVAIAPSPARVLKSASVGATMPGTSLLMLILGVNNSTIKAPIQTRTYFV